MARSVARAAGSRTPARLTLVFAHWCPHCDPLSLDAAPQLARTLGIPLRLLDIDVPAEEQAADQLVKGHGDWTEDYLIPQLFLEWKDGRVTHLLTGVPGNPDEGSREAWQRLLVKGRGILDPRPFLTRTDSSGEGQPEPADGRSSNP